MLEHLNHHLAQRYTYNNGRFVTAFYGIYQPAARTLTYASAGHPMPRIKRCGTPARSLGGEHTVPLGILDTLHAPLNTVQLNPGDQIILYTDGVTEAFNPQQDMFGAARLDATLSDCGDARGAQGDAAGECTARPLIDAVLTALAEFAEGVPAGDDRTLVVARVR